MKASNVTIEEKHHSKSKNGGYIVVTLHAYEEARAAYFDLLAGNIDIENFNNEIDGTTFIITKHYFGNNKTHNKMFLAGFYAGQGYSEDTLTITDTYKQFFGIIK